MPKLDRCEFNRRCRAHDENPKCPFWEESWAGLVEYERCLKEKHYGKNIRAMRTWNGIKNKGLILSTQNRVLSGKGEGFEILMASDKRQSTDEYVVLKYRSYFSPKAIDKAKTRIAEWDQDHAHTG